LAAVSNSADAAQPPRCPGSLNFSHRFDLKHVLPQQLRAPHGSAATADNDVAA